MTIPDFRPQFGTSQWRRVWVTGAMVVVLGGGCTAPTNPPPPPPPPTGAVASVGVSPGSNSVFVGKAVQFTATVRDANNGVLTGRAVTWTSTNPSLATVSATGQVIGLYQGGPVTIRATVEGVIGTATVTVVPPQEPSVVEARSVLDSSGAAFLRFAPQVNGDPAKALAAAANRIEADPRVGQVHLIDSTYFLVELKSGMVTGFGYNDIDINGRSKFRGGGRSSTSASVALTHFRRAANLITNKKVLICSVATAEFYSPSETNRIADRFRNAGLGFQVTHLLDKQCDWRAVSTFSTYGLVILSAHGLPNAFLTGGRIDVDDLTVSEAQLKVAIDAQNSAGTYDRVVAGDVAMIRSLDIVTAEAEWWKSPRPVRSGLWVTSQFIRSLRMPNTIVFGNMCYSGAILGDGQMPFGFIQPAFMNTGLISYFAFAALTGQSTGVDNDFAKAMEDTLTSALMVDGDSTGIAHLDAQNREFLQPPVTFGRRVYNSILLFRQFGSLDYSYVKVAITPETTEGEFGKPIDFVADDENSAPTNAIYEWDFGDGTPKVRVNGLPLVQHTFKLPPGTGSCQVVTYVVTLDLLNNATGTPIRMATTKGSASLKNACPNWKMTTFVDVDDLVDPPGTDPGQGGPLFDLLWGAESVPGSAMITVSGNQLSMRVKRAGVWQECCPPPVGADDYVFVWPTWSQDTTDLGTGTMTGVRTEGASEFRFQATRDGEIMTGTMTLKVADVDDETGQPYVSTYHFTFTATRMK